MDTLKIPALTGKARNSGPDCDSNRNRGIREFLAQPAELEWAFFTDDDQVFEPGTLVDEMLPLLYDHEGIDVLTKLYVRKTPPFQPVLFGDAYAAGSTRITFSELAEMRKQSELHIVGACGGGCLLVRRAVLEQLSDPWFNPGPGRSFGGDIGFCRKLKDAGIPLYALLRGVGHLMPTSIAPVWNEATESWQLEFLFGG